LALVRFPFRPILRLAAGCLLSGLLLGCPAQVIRDRPYAAPTAAELISHIQKSQAGILALRARAKADVFGREGRVKVDISVVAARPQQLRLAGENSLTGPLLTMATDGLTFQLLDVRSNRFQSGAVSACNMSRFLGVALHPSQVIQVLMGGVPLLPSPVASEVSWNGKDGGREVLTLRDARGVSEVISLQAEGKTWDVREAEGRDDKGQPVWRLRHEGFAPMALAEGAPTSVRLPAVTYIEDPPNKSDIRLRWRERELNPALEEGVFRLDAPPGVPTEPDICATSPADARPALVPEPTQKTPEP
jgi:hypothetical protein